MSKGVVVTGGAEGVGRAVAERFLEAGDRVHICDIREAALARALEEVEELEGTVADVGDPAAVEVLFAEAEATVGPVEILVNNVGIAGPRLPVEEISLEDWDRTLKVNLSGMFYCMKEALPGMKERRRGVVVNISSGSARTIPLNRSAYNVSKVAVEGLTRTVAREVGPCGVRVNAIQPGAVNNARMRRVLERKAADTGKDPETLKDDFLQYVSMRTLIEPREIADTCLFLASDQARHITGQVLAVDGLVEWEE